MVTGTDANYQTEVLDSDIPVLVDFWADWCMPCKMIEPHIEQIAEEYKGKLKVVKFNVDENPMTPQSLGITGIPTLILYKDGEIVERIVGAVPKEQIEELIKNYL